MELEIKNLKEWLREVLAPETQLFFQTFGYNVGREGWKIPPRSVNGNIVWLITKGQTKGSIEGAPLVLQPGSLLLIRSLSKHEFSLQASSRIERYYFRVEITRNQKPIDFPQAFHLRSNFSEALPLVKEIVSLLNSASDFREFRLKSLVALLFSSMFDDHINSDQSRRLTLEQTRQLADYVQMHIAERTHPRELARLIHLSHDYFTRVFRNTFGMPPKRWLLIQRIRQALLRIEDSSLNLSEIATELGYENVNMFSRQFMDVMGYRPSAHRKKTFLSIPSKPL